MTALIPHNKPLILPEDRAAADRVLQSGWIAHGPEGDALEREFAAYLGGGRACAVSSGSAGLFLALDTLGIGAGHRVAIPTYSCTALLNAVHTVQAVPVLVDNAPGSLNISASTLEQAASGKPLDATIAVHTYGEPVDVPSLRAHSRFVVEDCCQAVGGADLGRPLGSSGDLAVFSFYATKPITSGHGGLLYDPTGKYIERAFDYRNFDMPDVYRPRSNIQLSDIQAAIARSQFSRLSSIAALRREIAGRYLEAAPRNLVFWPTGIDSGTMPYRFVLQANNGEHEARIHRMLADAGIKAINPMETRELLHRYAGLDPAAFPNAEKLSRYSISIPLYPALGPDEIDRIVTILNGLPAA